MSKEKEIKEEILDKEHEHDHECHCDNNCECYHNECECTDDCECDDDHDCDDECCEEDIEEDITDNYNEMESRIKELEEKLLRQQADTINYRKRKDEEIGRILKYANEDLILGILPILDNFERAINMDDENLEDEVSKFLEGFKMIHQNLNQTLESFGVKEINGKDKPFNPTYHEAMLTEKVKNVEPSMVIEVLQKGYLLNDKVIRPAMVKVSE